jgi:hypothetical protein
VFEKIPRDLTTYLYIYKIMEFISGRVHQNSRPTVENRRCSSPPPLFPPIKKGWSDWAIIISAGISDNVTATHKLGSKEQACGFCELTHSP